MPNAEARKVPLQISRIFGARKPIFFLKSGV
jgi:hypothetical protein